MAIKVEDLRVGNLVWHPEYCETPLYKPDFIKWDFNKVEPVGLTDEWLKHFGFEVKTDENGISDAYLGENPVTKDWLLKLVNTSGTWFYRNAHFQIYYVHQLQNLHHALTGKELIA